MNFNIKDSKELLFIAIMSTALVAYYINFNMNLGIYCSDVYTYLMNALYFSGNNIHSTYSIYLSPVLCFLTSLLFDVGLIDKISIFIVTGVFAIFGNIGLYLLLRERFDSLLSICGTVLYATFSINLTWLANGTLDIPAVAVSIWIVYFLVLSLKKDPKYFTVLFPLLAIGFFIRYTVALMLPALVLYYLYERSLKIDEKDKKFICIGLIIGIIMGIALLMTINIMGNGYLGFDGLLVNGVKGNLGSTHDNAYNADYGYYISNMGNFISSSNTTFVGKNPSLNNPTVLSGLIFLILIVGSIIWVRRNNISINRQKMIGIILCILALISFSRVSSTITIILAFFGLYFIGRESENKMGYLMLCWILTYLIFQSYYIVKVNRYIIPILPPLCYFIMVGVEEINNKINRKQIIPIILIALFIIQGFTFTSTFTDTNEFNNPEEISNFIKESDGNWSNAIIGVYNIRPYFWYLGQNVTGIPRGHPQDIIDSEITYYISNVKQDNLTNFTEIKHIGELYLYKRTN